MTDVSDGVLHTLFRSDQGGHEQVVLCQDRATGLKAVIALHSTALGPALGGTRFYPYASEEEAVADALNLARGMSYKNAMAGLGHGGGKAVIIGDPELIKSEELLLAYGRFVASLGGRYVTACDVGTYVADMDVVARECRWTTGRSPRTAARATPPCSPPSASTRACGPPPSTCGATRRCVTARSVSRASARSATTWWSTCGPRAPRS
ncbi:hypothetical protein SHKM778_91890 [Streptomyces sp. KM77-8]|uniref:Valine dehydrogenase n=1 Tax=Streptomyces haneummycinicus TaxID=3074435 RepID=A0AAT9HZH2_9ACTN